MNDWAEWYYACTWLAQPRNDVWPKVHIAAAVSFFQNFRTSVTVSVGYVWSPVLIINSRNALICILYSVAFSLVVVTCIAIDRSINRSADHLPPSPPTTRATLLVLCGFSPASKGARSASEASSTSSPPCLMMNDVDRVSMYIDYLSPDALKMVPNALTIPFLPHRLT